MGVGEAPANEPIFKMRPFFLNVARDSVSLQCKAKKARNAQRDHGRCDEASDAQRGGDIDVDDRSQLLLRGVNKVGWELVRDADTVDCPPCIRHQSYMKACPDRRTYQARQLQST